MNEVKTNNFSSLVVDYHQKDGGKYFLAVYLNNQTIVEEPATFQYPDNQPSELIAKALEILGEPFRGIWTGYQVQTTQIRSCWIFVHS